jgi:hypothetical protein
MRFCLALLLLPVLARAQQQTQTVSCRFLGFQTGDTNTSLTCVADKSEAPCPFKTDSISEPVEVAAVDHVLSFIDPKDRKPACTVTLPATVRQALVVFMPNAKNAALPWRAFAIEDSEKTFPNGGALVINLHNADIRFAIGENKYLLKPGDRYAMQPPKQRDEFNMATMTFEFSLQDQWIKASESRLRFTEGLRYLMLAYRDPASQRPRLSTYQDGPYIPLPPESKAR